MTKNKPQNIAYKVRHKPTGMFVLDTDWKLPDKVVLDKHGRIYATLVGPKALMRQIAYAVNGEVFEWDDEAADKINELTKDFEIVKYRLHQTDTQGYVKQEDEYFFKDPRKEVTYDADET
jgi:hypothetical protein